MLFLSVLGRINYFLNLCPYKHLITIRVFFLKGLDFSWKESCYFSVTAVLTIAPRLPNAATKPSRQQVPRGLRLPPMYTDTCLQTEGKSISSSTRMHSRETGYAAHRDLPQLLTVKQLVSPLNLPPQISQLQSYYSVLRYEYSESYLNNDSSFSLSSRCGNLSQVAHK